MEDFFYRWKVRYGRLPLAMRNGIGLTARLLPQFLWHGFFYGTYKQRINKFLAVDNPACVKSLQLELLRDTVNWAIKHVPIYARMKRLSSFSDLTDFPIVKKEDYREFYERLTSAGMD